ncbi:DUF4908 domain-containing protein [Asticcacaulis sp. ZE23SCel15]|uniref:DUF4908 domain-containing protein n=1 Tax=Asticcacaulis sp. ZE23SCel15 TaxID=3059027 RepID=UPI002660107A|nr:DUF4908 domain-containing protein [Asticcacaulis sp. ZE23SCel15]WKL55908.1 DUF4908 domain-containing protein [Asticcacaulis sp. ZE23SCel15]
MRFSTRQFRLPVALSLLIGVMTLTGLGLGTAKAQNNLRDAMLGPSTSDSRGNSMPDVAHFMSEDGEGFVLDHTQDQPFIRFDGDAEVWALTPSPGPRGDVIFKNDVGEPILRSSRLGGLTLFSRTRPTGDPVAVSGKADAIKAGRMTPGLLFQQLARASKKASAAVSRLLPFDADIQTPGADYLFADAARVTADAIVDVANQNNGRKILEPIREVRLIEGRPPGVYMERNTLVLRLDHTQGWAGRPSSKRITKIIKTATKGR